MKKKIIISGFTIILIVSVIAFTIFNKSIFNYKNNGIKENNNIVSENVGENDDIIYEVFMSFDYVTGNPEKLYDMAELVLVADYIESVETHIEMNKNPYTVSEFKIDTIIKNKKNYELDETILVKYDGGIITLKQLLDSRDADFISKIGADDIDINDYANKKVNFKATSISDKSLDEQSKRILFLNYDVNYDYYVVLANDYGMLSYDSETNEIFDYATSDYKSVSFIK